MEGWDELKLFGRVWGLILMFAKIPVFTPQATHTPILS